MTAKDLSLSAAEVYYIKAQVHDCERLGQQKQSMEAQNAEAAVVAAIEKRIKAAYGDGHDAGVGHMERSSEAARTLALFIVLIAVASITVVAMVKEVDVQDVSIYIAPLTGIAGTVVGYWFGSQSDRRPTPARLSSQANEM
ncbi:hypothetical protein AB0L53_16235 [Nonomuraea sp. NPDC052129]|uniref:hypothetical protein n=1 Tax=Nonomuraea sp. NPDC052129 TaxID=3154651 RepID=UPI003431B33E